MGRSRFFASVTALALVASLGSPCVCLPGAAMAAEHSCCAPPAGYRLAEPGCCPDGGVGSDVGAGLQPPAAAAPALDVVASSMPAAALAIDRGQAHPAPAVSPPLTVRRL